MREFFKPWRRKAGCVTLAMACLCAGAWVRSMTIRDVCGLSPRHYWHAEFVSGHGSLRWHRYQLPPTAPPFAPYDSPILFHSTEHLAIADYVSRLEDSVDWHWQRFGMGYGSDRARLIGSAEVWLIPYTMIVIPLTLLSAYLLLSSPRPKKPEPTTVDET